MNSTDWHGQAPHKRNAVSRLGALWSLDVLMALMILILLNMLAMRGIGDAMFKAKATQSISLIKPHQLALIEHYAHTGEWLDSDVGLQDDVVRNAGNSRAGGDTMDRVMSGKSSARSKGGDEKSSPGDSVGATTVGISEGVILTLGIYTGLEGVAMLGVRPAVINAPEQPVVQWLCGRAPTPAGWQSPVTAAPTNVPDHLLYSFCRGGAAS